MKKSNKIKIFLLTIFLSSCGSSALDPILSFTSSAARVILGSSITLSWESQHARSCNASGDWSGSRPLSGSEEITISLPGINTFVLTCDGDTANPAVSTITVEGYRLMNGRLVDGYIRGASLFIDENEDFIEDSNEEISESDNEGSFEIEFKSGTIISQGGFDLDSGNLLENFSLSHPIDQYKENIVVTPITSLLNGLENKNTLKPSLGIDSSIDITKDDPVALRGDQGIYDSLYEKGNQITVLAFTLQNASNELNASTDNTLDYFDSIAEELEKEYNNSNIKVDIESEAFVKSVIENIAEKKDLTISEETKNDSSQIISSVLQIIQVKSDISITQSILSFGTGEFQRDIEGLFSGSISDDRLTQYKTDIIQLLQDEINIDDDEITPDITATDDALSVDEDGSAEINLVLNDDYLTNAPITVSIESALNGTASLNGNVLKYTPYSDYNGSDSIDYTITQKSKSDTAKVNITVNPINDLPSISALRNYSVLEGTQSLFDVNADDIEGDALSYSLSGVDVALFSISGSGLLSFINKTRFVAPKDAGKDNVYNITVLVSDGNGSTSRDFIITVQQKNTKPVFRSLPSTILVPENSKKVYQILVGDGEGDNISYTLSGDDSDQFNLSSNGLISFKSTKDYEDSTKNKFNISITISDGSLTTTRSAIIMITDQDESQFGESSIGKTKLE